MFIYLFICCCIAHLNLRNCNQQLKHYFLSLFCCLYVMHFYSPVVFLFLFLNGNTLEREDGHLSVFTLPSRRCVLENNAGYTRRKEFWSHNSQAPTPATTQPCPLSLPEATLNLTWAFIYLLFLGDIISNTHLHTLVSYTPICTNEKIIWKIATKMRCTKSLC